MAAPARRFRKQADGGITALWQALDPFSRNLASDVEATIVRQGCLQEVEATPEESAIMKTLILEARQLRYGRIQLQVQEGKIVIARVSYEKTLRA